jgi:hypothetical protein
MPTHEGFSPQADERSPLLPSSLFCTHAAADAISYAADVRLLPLEAELVLLDEMLLLRPLCSAGGRLIIVF